MIKRNPGEFGFGKGQDGPYHNQNKRNHDLWKRLSLSSNVKSPQVIAFTSCHQGEGVSTIATQFSKFLASENGGRILAIDANFRYPSAHQTFGVSLVPGLSGLKQVLNNENGDPSTYVQKTSIDNLDLLSAGQTNEDLSSMYESKKFSSILNDWKNKYRYILIDMPPISEMVANAQLARLTDGVIFVIEADRIRWEIAMQLKNQLDQTRVKILGSILNKRSFPIPRWLYQRL